MRVTPESGLRLLVLSHMYPSRLHDTAGVFIHRHVQALRAAGVDARVVAPIPWAPRLLWFNAQWRAYGQTPRVDEWEGTPVRRVPYLQLPTAAFQPWAGEVMARPLARVLRQLRREFPFELIHSHTVTPDGLAALSLGREFGVPTVNSSRGSDLNEYPHTHPRRMEFTRKVLLHTDRMVTVSGALAGVARELTGGRVQPTVIYNGVDQTVFRPAEDRPALRLAHALPPDRPLLLFVGRCERDKGVGELLQAFLGLAPLFPAWVLVCLGDGGFRPELLRRVEEAGLGDRVIAPGRVDQATVAGVMRSADAFVLPSWAEGMPNVLLEAMACGLPCVSTPVGGVPEVLEHGVNGLSTPARDGTALQHTLADLFTDRERAVRLGARALQTIRERFSWESNARAHRDLYHSLLAARRPGRGERR